jgi:acetyltransferase-like isoleucine patch superfamily enzyme
MRISELPLGPEDRLVRDADIENLGFLNTQTTSVLAPLGAKKYLLELAANPNVSAVFATDELAGDIPEGLGLICSPNPVESLFRLHLRLEQSGVFERLAETTVDPSCSVHPSAVVADRGVVIGPDCHVGPQVVIEPGTRIGSRVVLGPGVVVGGKGFEVREVDGRRQVIPHVGGVRIDDDVELQANTAVSRALLSGDTVIGEGTATDNLVHIAHNAILGKRCRLAACAMIAGSVRLGDDVWIGPNATISNGIKIGDGAQISLGAVVTRHVEAGMKVTGHFAIEHRMFMKVFKSMLSLGR